MTNQEFSLEDLGEQRVLTVDGKEHVSHYSERVLRALIEHKGPGRAVEYLSHGEVRGKLLKPFFDCARRQALHGSRVLEVGSSFGHITELLDAEETIGEIVCCDVDPVFLRIVEYQKQDLPLRKVSEIVPLDTCDPVLPFDDGSFDVCLLFAVIEHLPFPNRFQYVDEYWRVLKHGGYMVILDTPNRLFPWERHSLGLPFVHRMKPEWAFVFGKLFRRLRADTELTEFVRPGTGWRNSSYTECLPATRSYGVKDVSSDCGYNLDFWIQPQRVTGRMARFIYRILGKFCSKRNIPLSIFLPSLHIVLQKE
jgi:SAM-dependent methyltransferase